MKKQIINQDIIDFRYKLIHYLMSDSYYISTIFCNDGRNVMTNEKKKVIEDILIEFNHHFGIRNYDLG